MRYVIGRPHLSIDFTIHLASPTQIEAVMMHREVYPRCQNWCDEANAVALRSTDIGEENSIHFGTGPSSQRLLHLSFLAIVGPFGSLKLVGLDRLGN
jgi:hypothetical protein